jgi:hypothetical protein
MKIATVGLLALMVAVPLARGAGAKDAPVPFPLALKLMLRTLTFDQRFAEHGTGDFTVLVATEPGQSAVREEALAAAKELEGFKILNRALRFVPAELRGGASLRDSVQKARASAVLVLPGLSEAGQLAVTQVAGDARLYTLSLDPALVERTMLLGVLNQDGRPRIALNRAAIRRLNVDFEKTLLGVAEIFPGADAATR